MTELRGVNDAIPEEERQPTRRNTAEVSRTFDQTFLDTQAQEVVHRDYLAHAFRWGFAKERFITHEVTHVLDVGCGPGRPAMAVLFGGQPNTLAASYTGVDLNKVKPTKHARSKIYSETNFLDPEQRQRIRDERGECWDLILNFEVIEHMPVAMGKQLLGAFEECLADDGRLLLSTPVYDGKARAKNHVHEWLIPELQGAMEDAGLEVVKRYGTFMNHNEVRKVATPAQLEVYNDLRQFYTQEIMATFLAPLYPDNSRNNLWVIRRQGDK